MNRLKEIDKTTNLMVEAYNNIQSKKAGCKLAVLEGGNQKEHLKLLNELSKKHGTKVKKLNKF